MLRSRAPFSDQFIGKFISHDGTGNKNIPEGHYRIEEIWYDEEDQGYWSQSQGHVRSTYISLSAKDGKNYEQPLNNFHRGPWEEVKDPDLIGWLVLQWS